MVNLPNSPNSSKLVQLKQKDIKKIREIIFNKQDGICPICNNPIINPVLDHDHKKRLKGTGLCRGVICSSCNVFLAKIENNAIRYRITKDHIPKVLRNIAKYLENPQTKYIHPSEIPPKPKLQKKSINDLNKEYQKKYPNKKILYPKSGHLTKKLDKIFKQFHVKVKFYNDKINKNI